MKRNYFEPEMKISTFSSENIITTSTTETMSATDYINADTKAVLDYTNIVF